MIRIRLEGTDASDTASGWVAHVTNVLEQSERYVRDLNDLTRFIAECLTRMGVAPDRRARHGRQHGTG